MSEGTLRPVAANSLSEGYGFIKSWDALLKLGAFPTNEEISKWRQSLEQNYGTILDLAVSLRQRGEGDVAFVHGRRSVAVYSGSSAP
jgi:hypothetical protein